MRSQAWYNTNTQVFLTLFLIYLIDNKRASYKSFTELSDVNPKTFSKYLKYFKEMLTDLKMNITLIEEEIQETEIDTSTLKTKYYQIQYIDDNLYQFEYKHLDEEKRIRYSMTILYLLLKNHNYIKLSSVDNIFPRMKSDIFKKMISMLQGVVADEITKNEINSYILLEDY